MNKKEREAFADDKAKALIEIYQNIDTSCTIIDAELIALVKSGESWSSCALYDLFCIFAFGNDKYEPNNVLADKYFSEVFELCHQRRNYLFVSELISYYGYYAEQSGQGKELAHERYSDALGYMAENLPLEEWSEQVLETALEALKEAKAYKEGLKLVEQ